MTIGTAIIAVVALTIIAAVWLWLTHVVVDTDEPFSPSASTTVTIGRNVGDHPLIAPEWRAYRDAVHALLTEYGATIVTDADYQGEWEGEREDAHVDVALWPEGEPSQLEDALARIGRTYGQDAIGLSTGPARLV